MIFSTVFDRHHATKFIMFSMSHWFALTLLAVIIMLFYVSRFVIRMNWGFRSGIRLLLLFTLILSEIGLQTWYLSHGVWRSSGSLPLELCGITLLLSIIMLITRSRSLYSFLYFAGIGGAFIALVTPNLMYPFPHFRFWLFFIVHGAIILASLYMTWIEGFRPTWKSLFSTMIYLNIVAAAVWIANHFLGANYMFLAHKPSTYSFLDYFGPYPYYLLIEELFAFIVFLAMYVLFFWLPDRYKSRRNYVAEKIGHSTKRV